MKIATWNVNSVRVRIEQMLEFLKASDIDTLLLQELKCTTEDFPTEILDDFGYNCAVFGQKTYNGVAIISKHMIEDVVIGSDVFVGDIQSRYIEALIKGYKVASVYVPNGQDPSAQAYKYKLAFLAKLKEHIKKTIEFDKYIIGGDFNIALTDEDVYDPEKWKDRICCTDQERNALLEIIDIGLVDSLRIFQDGKAYTWWDYRTNGFAKNNGLRLDYIFSYGDFKIKSCFIDKEMRGKARPSDHAPVVIEI